MRRTPPANPVARPELQSQPSAEHAELAQREAAALMQPVAQRLLRHAVSYPAFAELPKAVFLAATSGEMALGEAKPTQSAMSMLSGLRRKDMRALLQAPASVRM